MFKIIFIFSLSILLGYAPLVFATGGGGGGGGSTGSSVPFLNIIGQGIFILILAIWYRKKR